MKFLQLLVLLVAIAATLSLKRRRRGTKCDGQPCSSPSICCKGKDYYCVGSHPSQTPTCEGNDKQVDFD